jgi:hypothetical protein
MKFFGLLTILTALLLLLAFLMPGLIEIWVLDNYSDLVREYLGVESSVQDVRISPLKGFLQFESIALKNPKGFSERDFIHIQTLTAHVSLLTLLKQQIEIDDLVADTIQLNIECRKSICNYQPFVDRLKSLTSKIPSKESRSPSGRIIKIISTDLRNITTNTQLGASEKSLVLKVKDVHLDNPSKVLNGILRLDSAIKGISDLISGKGPDIFMKGLDEIFGPL